MKIFVYGCGTVLMLSVLAGCVVEPPRYTHHYPVAYTYNNYPEPVYDQPYPYVVNRYYSPVVVRRELVPVPRPVPVPVYPFEHGHPPMGWQHGYRDHGPHDNNAANYHDHSHDNPQPAPQNNQSPFSRPGFNHQPGQQRPDSATHTQPAQNQGKPSKPQRGKGFWSKKDKQQQD